MSDAAGERLKCAGSSVGWAGGGGCLVGGGGIKEQGERISGDQAGREAVQTRGNVGLRGVFCKTAERSVCVELSRDL